MPPKVCDRDVYGEAVAILGPTFSSRHRPSPRRRPLWMHVPPHHHRLWDASVAGGHRADPNL